MGKGTGGQSLSQEEPMAGTLQELFEHELREIYDAEHKLVRALESMAKKTPDESLAQGFREHRDATREQIKRLEQVFRLLDRKPRRESCRGINGLIAEFTKFVKEEEPSEEVLNTFATGAALKVENYEIVAYESLLRLTNSIELGDAIDPLRHNLLEERRTAEQLEAFADELSGPVPGEEEDLAVVSDASQETITVPDSEQVISS
jgi:ferritin-like metal-binding protein YciE